VRLPIERVVNARYRLDRLIGRGGMGAVYEAQDLRLDRQVAVKVMISRDAGQRIALRRFQREARAAARLNHPNVVAIHDYGAIEPDGAFLVMERVPGQTLRAELERARALAPAAAAEWIDPLLDGLQAAHHAGIVHRDLKPENVIGHRNADGRLSVKVLDFGLAKLRLTEHSATGTMTAVGAVLGTFGYMSPEQLLAGEVDHRADVFAVGVMVAEMVTGTRPFRGATYLEILNAVLIEPYHLPGATPAIRRLDALLQQCLAKDPRNRLASVATLRTLLVDALRACPPLVAGGASLQKPAP
jgi:serine/threonine-protein kinase